MTSLQEKVDALSEDDQETISAIVNALTYSDRARDLVRTYTTGLFCKLLDVYVKDLHGKMQEEDDAQ